MRHIDPQQDEYAAVRAGRWHEPIGRLRLAGFIEGTTLLLLLGVAVPLKHLAGLPLAVSLVGPLHGLAFVAYLVAAIEVVGAGELARRDAWRTTLVALLPFGTFMNDRFLARLQARQCARMTASSVQRAGGPRS